ncbi:hypothetical protein AHF37_01114 [Paragonimus kellicotti]|nr:hypothetical protein AHF37_01114 [Paragonimus kellicotti]
MIQSTDQEGAYPTSVGLAHKPDEQNSTAYVFFPVPQKDTNSETTKTLSFARFADLRFSSPLLRDLSAAGFSRTSPVQIKDDSSWTNGMDMIVQAKSGTRKTVVFVVVLLEEINVQRPVLQALVLSPTHEIVLQSQTVFQRLGAHIPGVKCQLFVGGSPLADDLCRLQQCHIAVGHTRVVYVTLLRLAIYRLIRSAILYWTKPICYWLAVLRPSSPVVAQSNAFPADFNYICHIHGLPVEEHLQRYMNNPALVRLVSHDPALLGVRQFFLTISSPDCSPASVFAAKVNTRCKLLSSVKFQQCLIFSSFHNSAQELCDALRSRGWSVSYISSTLDKEQRFRAFSRLRTFHCRVLVSTDLTSPGIDAENVNLVVILEVPREH